MSVIDNLITDRTSADVERVRALRAIPYGSMTTAQKNEWDAAMKGAYDYTDLNRVGEAVAYVVNQINYRYWDTWNICDDYGVAWDAFFDPQTYFPHIQYPESITTKTDWTRADRPTATQLSAYLQTVYDLVYLIPVAHTLPTSMSRLTPAGANEIERVIAQTLGEWLDWIVDMGDAIEATSRAWFYSGDLYGGEL